MLVFGIRWLGILRPLRCFLRGRSNRHCLGNLLRLLRLLRMSWRPELLPILAEIPHAGRVLAAFLGEPQLGIFLATQIVESVYCGLHLAGALGIVLHAKVLSVLLILIIGWAVDTLAFLDGRHLGVGARGGGDAKEGRDVRCGDDVGGGQADTMGRIGSRHDGGVPRASVREGDGGEGGWTWDGHRGQSHDGGESDD